MTQQYILPLIQRPPLQERLRFIDRLRGLAALVMLEVHVVNALLAPRYRVWPRLAVVDFLNGLVAPAFLFCAGFGAALALRRAFYAPVTAPPTGPSPWPGVLRNALRRSAELLLLGYALHGYGVLWRGPGDAKVMRELLRVDILQVIGLSLLFVYLLAFALRRARWFQAAALVSGVLVLLATPAVRALSGASWPAAARPYFSARAPAEFSLFPWSAFALLGAAVAALPSPAWARKLTLSAALAGAGAVTLAVLAPSLFPAHDPWLAGPGYTLLRYALVCGLAALLARFQDSPGQQRLDPVIMPFARHSLLVYSAHLPLVYGGLGVSLRAAVGPTQGPLGCLLGFLLLALLMYLLARLADRWDLYRKTRNR